MENVLYKQNMGRFDCSFISEVFDFSFFVTPKFTIKALVFKLLLSKNFKSYYLKEIILNLEK